MKVHILTRSIIVPDFHCDNPETFNIEIQDGERHYLATTQFQHSSCRKAFPSFDDPGLKQTFSFDCEYLYGVQRNISKLLITYKS